MLCLHEYIRQHDYIIIIIMICMKEISGCSVHQQQQPTPTNLSSTKIQSSYCCLLFCIHNFFFLCRYTPIANKSNNFRCQSVIKKQKQKANRQCLLLCNGVENAVLALLFVLFACVSVCLLVQHCMHTLSKNVE